MVYSEKPYDIPLRDAWRVPRTKRAEYAINIIRKFIIRHSTYTKPGTNERVHVKKVIIDNDLNEYIWARGREKPPRKVRVKAVVLEPSEDSEEPEVDVSLYESEKNLRRRPFPKGLKVLYPYEEPLGDEDEEYIPEEVEEEPEEEELDTGSFDIKEEEEGEEEEDPGLPEGEKENKKNGSPRPGSSEEDTKGT